MRLSDNGHGRLISKFDNRNVSVHFLNLISFEGEQAKMIPQNLQTIRFFYQQPNFYFSPSRNDERVAAENLSLEENSKFSKNRYVGLIVGPSILVLTFFLLGTEVFRIYFGSSGENDKEKANWIFYVRWIFPWSSSVLISVVLFFFTGIVGIVAGKLLSYSTTFVFFAFSFFSLFVLIFLLTIYSIEINRFENFSPPQRILSIVGLTISCLLTLLVLFVVLFSTKTLELFSEKNEQNRTENLNVPAEILN